MHELLLLKRKFRISLIVILTLVWGLAQAQNRTITGTVKDGSNGDPLPGVNILVKGTNNGTISDANGAFSIEVTSDDDVISFSFVGYKSSEFVARGVTNLEVSLATDIQTLEEIVVVGYGEQKKSVVTGAIASVKSKDFQDMPIVRVEDALKGRVSGVTIAASSGAPGAASTISIRGLTSINNSEPLIVVDGVVITGGLDYLNSSDIESIEVLKDAASAAIYGTKAASGVILVTTKKGKSSGGMQVNYNGYVGSQAPAHKLDLLNATQYATIINEQLVARGLAPKFANPSSLGAGTDWQKLVFNNSAKIQNHELSFSGGNDKSTYYSSLNYFKQDGIVSTSVSSYERISARFNSTHKATTWLTYGNNFSLSHTKSLSGVSPNDYFGGPLASAINLDPVTPLTVDAATAATAPYSTNSATIVRDANGNPYGISPYVGQEMTNPIAWAKIRKGNYDYSDNLVGNLFVEVEPIKALKFRSSIGGKLSIWGNEGFTPLYFLSNTQSNLINNSFNRSMNRGFDYTFTNTVSYSKIIGDHNIYGLIGTEARDINGDTRGISGTFLNSPATDFASASANWPYTTANSIAGGYERQPYTISSTFAKVNYDYQGRYLFTGIIRRDGSSNFGSNNKYGTFPSASVGWITSKESFWKENDIVNFLKVRFGYGVNGNDNLGPFYYTSTVGSIGAGYVFGTNQVLQGYAPKAPANPDLRWEQTAQTNVGIDATILQDFSLTVEYFVKKTKDMLMQPQLPGYVGASGLPYANVATLENKGFEVELGYNKKFGDIGVNFKGNLSSYKNKVTDLGKTAFRTQSTMQSSSYEVGRQVVGQPIGEFYGFDYSGVFQSQAEIDAYLSTTSISWNANPKPGDFIWKDLNGDGTVDEKDRTYLGNPTPTLTFGFTSTITYKNFDLIIFAQGVSGNKIFNQLRRLDIPEANFTTEALGRWTGPGTSNSFARLVEGDPSGNFNRPSKFYLQDGAYFRFKNVQLGYTFSPALLKKIGFQKARIYVSGNNLITFTKYNGFDPEIGGGQGIYGIDRGKYPVSRSFMGGVNFTF